MHLLCIIWLYTEEVKINESFIGIHQLFDENNLQSF